MYVYVRLDLKCKVVGKVQVLEGPSGACAVHDPNSVIGMVYHFRGNSSLVLLFMSLSLSGRKFQLHMKFIQLQLAHNISIFTIIYIHVNKIVGSIFIGMICVSVDPFPKYFQDSGYFPFPLYNVTIFRKFSVVLPKFHLLQSSFHWFFRKTVDQLTLLTDLTTLVYKTENHDFKNILKRICNHFSRKQKLIKL